MEFYSESSFGRRGKDFSWARSVFFQPGIPAPILTLSFSPSRPLAICSCDLTRGCCGHRGPGWPRCKDGSAAVWESARLCLTHPEYTGNPTGWNRMGWIWPIENHYFGIQNVLQQGSDVWALSGSKPTILWNDPFELIFHARLSKMNRFSSFRAKSLRKKNLGRNLDFCKSYFLWPLWNWGFGTNMESNAAVTLHFEDLAVKNYLFLKYVCIRLWKISNCFFKYFWSMWSFSF